MWQPLTLQLKLPALASYAPNIPLNLRSKTKCAGKGDFAYQTNESIQGEQKSDQEQN